MDTRDTKFTVVFNGDIRKLEGNPHKIESPFGPVQTVAVGDMVNDPKRDAAEDMYEALRNGRDGNGR